MRRIMILKVSSDLSKMLQEEITDEEIDILTKQTEKLEASEIRRWLDIFINSQNYIKRAAIVTLPLELAVLEALP
ncbi:MAG: hypothetical protein NTW73_00910 [Candidatus Parcubacteria bacterium]|nr:hypothetical protein [Candidatus Parcubacteria bacterium]